MKQIKVVTGYSGSHCVVWLGSDEYIDARKTHAEGFTLMEYVRNGFVRHSCIVQDKYAPETIMDFIRNLYCPNSLNQHKAPN